MADADIMFFCEFNCFIKKLKVSDGAGGIIGIIQP